MTKKSFIVVVSLILCLSSCKVQQIGKVNMISHKNVEIGNFGNYVQLAAYARGNDKKIQKSKAKTIEEAIDQTVKDVPGGIFIVNAKIYLVKGKFYAVEGDVWGVQQTANYQGFAIGDRVIWKTITGYVKGTIESLKDSETAIVIEDGSEKRTDVKLVKLSKADNEDAVQQNVVKREEFKVGEKVMWKTLFTGYKQGVIEAVKDADTYVVKEDGTETRVDVKYDKLVRVGQPE